jgi:hypothetical protein
MVCFKKHKNVIRLEDAKEGLMAIGMEGTENVDICLNDTFPQTRILPTKRTYLGAIIRSLRYSRMGIMNCIIKS